MDIAEGVKGVIGQEQSKETCFKGALRRRCATRLVLWSPRLVDASMRPRELLRAVNWMSWQEPVKGTWGSWNNKAKVGEQELYRPITLAVLHDRVTSEK